MRGILIVGLGSLWLTGCMTARMPDPTTGLVEAELDRDAVIQAEAQPDSHPSGVRIAPAKGVLGPDWKQVTFRGRVLTQGDQAPVPMAVVSVFEGEDRLFTTLSDEDGMFELPAKLYGLEREGLDGKTTWRPEPYYRIEVDAGEPGRASREIAKIAMDERVLLFVS